MAVFVLTAVSGATETIHDPYNAVAAGPSFTGCLRESFCHLAVDPKQSIWNSIAVRNCPIQGFWRLPGNRFDTLRFARTVI